MSGEERESVRFRGDKPIQAVQQFVHTPRAGYMFPALPRRAGRVGVTATNRGLRWLPALSLVGALGLLLVAFADTGARYSTIWAEPLFWTGLLVLFAPIAVRLASSEAARSERIGLVTLLGLGLYLVKVLHSPLIFTLHDEFIHWHTANDILKSGHLFRENPLLPASALFPGLEIVTAALTRLSGLTIFDAGVVVVGIARLMLVLSLYLLFERISGSDQVAGIGTMLYMANPNFVFFSAMLSYESLALPLAALALFAMVRHIDLSGAGHAGMTVVALLALGAIVTTHHLSSYVLAAFLVLWTFVRFHDQHHLDVVGVFAAVIRWYAGKIASWQLADVFAERLRRLWSTTRRGAGAAAQADPSGMALITLVASLAWLVYIANIVVGYISPHFRGAIVELINMIVREPTSGRQLFTSSSGQVAPLLERLTGLAAVGLILAGLPFGLLDIWRRWRDSHLVLTLAGIALVYPLSLVMRLTGAGWEIANRSSEFLFIGISFVLAVGVVKYWLPDRARWWRSLAAAACASVMFTGGIIAGWPPIWRMPGPYLPAAVTRSVEAQGLSVAEWARSYLGPDNRVGADRTNGLLIGSYGEQHVVTALSGDVNTAWVLFAPSIGEREEAQIRRGAIQYIVVDRRLVGAPSVARSFYPETPIERALDKFDHTSGVSRIFDSGDITIYDLGAFTDEP